MSVTLTADERMERRRSDLAMQAQSIERLTASDGWQAWLRSRGAFHTYSLHNQLLIAMQDPDATRAAGFRRWLDLGYAVKKGEKAIRIWMPLRPTKKQLAELQPGDKPHVRFRLGPVFTDRQVQELEGFEGQRVALAPPTVDLTGSDLGHHCTALRELCGLLDITVQCVGRRGAANGWYTPATRTISLIDDRPLNAYVRTFIHELCHALLDVDAADDDPDLDYATEEVVVESATWSLLCGLGVDPQAMSAPYVASWLQGRDPADVLPYARLIDRLCRRIEGALHPTPTTTEED